SEFDTTAQAQTTIAVTVHETADAPTLAAPATLGVVFGGSVALGITASAAEADQNAPSIQISGLGSSTLTNTAGDTLTVVNGSITLTAAQLAGLTLHPANDTNLSLTVKATDIEFDTSAQSTKSIAVAVTPAAPSITTVSDDVAPLTGTLANPGFTNDTDL